MTDAVQPIRLPDESAIPAASDRNASPRLSLVTARGAAVAPAYEHMPDQALVIAARLGDRDSFAQLYLRYAQLVHAILITRVPAAEAQDLVQDVFALALDRLKQLHTDTAFGPWISTITRNRATDFLRSRQRKRRWFALLPKSDNTAQRPPKTTTDTAEETEEILTILRNLPECYRETLALRLIENMSGPLIAKRTGLTEGSVRINLHRGMQLLRNRLQEEGWSL